MEQTGSDQISEKFETLVRDAEKLKGKEFRLALEELVNDGGEEAEFLLIQYLNDRKLNLETRKEIIRVAGYLQLSSFLVPLKKIIDTEQHSRIQQEAIISVAKFNDRRALNILSSALQRINNPLLMSTLNAEISRIKENNPILALLPRFQEGQKNPKTFRVTLQILKRILTPTDATIFTKFLNSPDPLVQSGAFEILCVSGDIFHDEDILGFYHNRCKQIPGIDKPECDELYFLTDHIKQYLSRYHFLVEEQIPNLKEQYAKVGDIRVKQLLLSMICKSKDKAVIPFLEDVYHKEPKLKVTIIQELSGNDTAADFLFELYKTDKEQKNAVIQSLLNIKKGLDYFVCNFFSLEFEEQELIAQNLPYAGQHDLADFIKKIFQSDIYRLKEILLTKVKETYEFSVKEILFAPGKEREFYFMGDEYLNTIIRLFPVTAVKKLMEKIVSEDLSVTQSKKYLLKISEVIPLGLIFNFRDKTFITTLFNKIIRANNAELSVLFLKILKHIKTLDPVTHWNLRECLSLFITQRKTNITPKEKGELARNRRNIKDLYQGIQKLEEGKAALKRLFEKKTVDFDFLVHVVKTFPMAVVMYKEQFLAYLSTVFQQCNSGNVGEWTEFFTQFPRLAAFIKPAIQAKVQDQQDLAFNALQQLIDTLSGHPLRLVMIFKNRHLTAVLREEFQEVIPHIPVKIDETQLNDADILLCDTEVLRNLILKSKTLPEKIYLFMESLAGFADFKAYNTRNFVQPFIFYRIVKEIVHDIYL